MYKIGINKEKLMIYAGFVISLLHWSLCFAYFIFLLFLLLKYRIQGCIRILLIMTTRTLLSTGVSCTLNSIVSYEKFALIFLLSFYILYLCRKEEVSKTVIYLRRAVILFTIYNITISFVASSYPVVSSFKAISYAIPFCAVVTGINVTSDFDWINYLYEVLFPIMLASFILLPIPSRTRIVNSDFQGIINHPNLFGIFGSFFIGVLLYNMINHKDKNNLFNFITIFISFYLVYLTKSRTGMFSALIMIVIYWFSQPINIKIRLLYVFIAIIVMGILLSSINPDLFGTIYDFIFKRGSTNIWESRETLYQMTDYKYDSNPLFGSGFLTPYYDWIRSYEFSMSLTYETGNIVKAVLADCGIIGSIIFWAYMFYIFVHTNVRNWILFFYPIVISMGEMAFFSTNNIAIYYYLFYGLCLSTNNIIIKGNRND